MRRLHNIRQLGALELVIRNGRRSYSRIEHMRGCESLARTIGNRLMELTAALPISDRRRVDPADVLLLRLAALMHDVGHGALSHSLDMYLEARGLPEQAACHEKRGIRLIRFILADVWLLGPHWDRMFPRGRVGLQRAISALVLNRRLPRAVPPCFAELINSGTSRLVDIDRLDYLPRDAAILIHYHAGAAASAQVTSLISKLRLNPGHTRVMWPRAENRALLYLRRWLRSNAYVRGDAMIHKIAVWLTRLFDAQPELLTSMFLTSRDDAVLFCSYCIDSQVLPMFKVK